MKTLKTLEPLSSRLLEIQRINSAASVLSWDQETYMPAGGGTARAEQIATLQGIAHQQLVSSDTERLLGTWLDLQTGLALEQDGELWDESSNALLREVWRDYSRARKLPSDFFWRKIWTSFLLSLYSFCSSEEAVTGDIDGGDNG